MSLLALYGVEFFADIDTRSWFYDLVKESLLSDRRLEPRYVITYASRLAR